MTGPARRSERPGPGSRPARSAVVVALGVVAACVACSSPTGPDGEPAPPATGSPPPVTRSTEESIGSSPSSGPPGIRPPPAPTRAAQSLGPDSPPVIWISGVLRTVDDRQLLIEEPFGSMVTVDLLGADATSFHRVVDGAWEPVSLRSARAGDPTCIESLLASDRLVALRVFLGAGCGPS